MIEIKKAKLNTDCSLKVEYTEVVVQPGSKEDPFTRDMKSDTNLQVHIDLKAALEQLMPHMVIILELGEPTETWVPDPEELKPIIRNLCQTYEVTGVTLKGGDKPGCVISGIKKLSTGKVLALNTPLTGYDEQDYEYGLELEKCINHLVSEIKLYVIEQKHAESLQTELDLPT